MLSSEKLFAATRLAAAIEAAAMVAPTGRCHE
jgi:hypothetical protein